MPVPTRTMPAACFHVLLSLANNPRHGLGIMDEVEQRTGGAVLLGPGSLYGSLKRLVSESLIREGGRPPEDEDDPRRRYYEITPDGDRALRQELRLLANIVDDARDKDLIPGVSS